MRHLRVLPELRTEQLQNQDLFTPADALYFGVNYDLVEVNIPTTVRRSSLPTALARIARSKAPVLELPEPLWARFLPRNVCLAAMWTVSGLFRGRIRRARTYAIENNDADVALFGYGGLPSWLQRLTRRAIGALVFLMFERIAYGSQGAAASYRSLPGVQRIASRVFTELPARPSSTSDDLTSAGSAVFVGRLEQRKGIHLLMPAWEAVETQLPHARLDIMGSGPLEHEVSDWVAARPSSRSYHGQLPNRDVVSRLPTYAVLAAPSIRWGRWREQIGLPIKDALGNGLTVVTTSETGLAQWLSEHGHRVTATPLSTTALTVSLIDALQNPIPRTAVISALPSTSQRVEADHWLHS